MHARQLRFSLAVHVHVFIHVLKGADLDQKPELQMAPGFSGRSRTLHPEPRELSSQGAAPSIWSVVCTAIIMTDSDQDPVLRANHCVKKKLLTRHKPRRMGHLHCSCGVAHWLGQVRERFTKLGFVGRELETTLGWIQDGSLLKMLSKLGAKTGIVDFVLIAPPPRPPSNSSLSVWTVS